jgi:hypothetical protein
VHPSLGEGLAEPARRLGVPREDEHAARAAVEAVHGVDRADARSAQAPQQSLLEHVAARARVHDEPRGLREHDELGVEVEHLEPDARDRAELQLVGAHTGPSVEAPISLRYCEPSKRTRATAS